MWQIIIDFCVENWKLLISIFLEFITLIIFLCKKKVKVCNSISSDLAQVVPGFIKDAELKYPESKSGNNKLAYVLKESLSYISAHYTLSEGDALKEYGRVIISYVEEILSTPAKK